MFVPFCCDGVFVFVSRLRCVSVVFVFFCLFVSSLDVVVGALSLLGGVFGCVVGFVVGFVGLLFGVCLWLVVCFYFCV